MLVNELSRVGWLYKHIQNGTLSRVFSWKHSKIFQNISFLYFFAATAISFLYFFIRLWMVAFFRSSRSEVFSKNGVLKKETWAQVFPCEFCEIFKNTYFNWTPPVAGCFFWYNSSCLLLNFKFHSQHHKTAMWKTKNNLSIVRHK